jgi:hypothetical protein
MTIITVLTNRDFWGIGWESASIFDGREIDSGHGRFFFQQWRDELDAVDSGQAP